MFAMFSIIETFGKKIFFIVAFCNLSNETNICGCCNIHTLIFHWIDYTSRLCFSCTCLILRTFINSYNLQRMMASALYSFVCRVCDCYCIWVGRHGLFIYNICLPLGCPKSPIATTSSRITVVRVPVYSIRAWN